MTKEQEKAIEKLRETQDSYLKDELDTSIEVVLNLIQEQQAEIEKKDKIIYEIAKAFKQDDIRNVEEIIQYFKRKVENGGKGK